MGVAYFVTGLPHVALLALVTAIAAMLPFCAPITFGLAALWLVAQGSVAAGIGLAVFGSVVVFIAEHFVRPVLIGNSTRLPFLLVLFGILGGAETFGLLGIFMALKYIDPIKSEDPERFDLYGLVLAGIEHVVAPLGTALTGDQA